MRLDSRRRARRGTVLVLYAMLFFGLLAVAALVIDLGSARLTQTLMQSAADTAAVEGLRNRDATTGEPARPLAADTVAFAFADADLGDGRVIRYGAGPQFTLTGGIGGEVYGSQLLTPDGMYKPSLQANIGNEQAGDVVAGNFTPTPFVGPAENADYSRNDGFEPAVTGDALLVRLRRSNEPPVDGVSSPGPTLPFLFGRGSMIQPGTSGYNPRRDGITVRATAVARAVPAKSVGPVQFDAVQPRETDVEGLTPFALSRTFWATMGTAAVELTPDANGVLTAAGNPAGRAIDAARVLAVGHRLTDRAAAAVTFTSAALACFVPIFDTIPGQGEWFIGFGLVEVSATTPLTVRRRAGNTAFAPDSALIARRGLPFRNATAAVLQSADRPDLGQVNAIPAGAPLDGPDGILARNAALPDAVLSPVLVR